MTAPPSDPHGLWAWRLVRRWERLRTILSTAHARAGAAFWGVELAPGCVFHGRPVFRRAWNSTIRIGAAGVFRSATWANQVGLDRPCQISTLRAGASVEIGRAAGCSGTVIAAAESIILGDHVLCGASTTITDTDWHGLAPAHRDDPAVRPVVIEDYVWLGLGVTVLKGVRIGRGAVIGAGSVVNRSIPPYSLAAGQPARVIRALEPCVDS